MTSKRILCSPWIMFFRLNQIPHWQVACRTYPQLQQNRFSVLFSGKIHVGIYFSQCTQTVVIQTVKRATLTGLEQTGNASNSSQNRHWLWGKNKLETTEMDNQPDGKNKPRWSTDARLECSDCDTKDRAFWTTRANHLKTCPRYENEEKSQSVTESVWFQARWSRGTV